MRKASQQKSLVSPTPSLAPEPFLVSVKEAARLLSVSPWEIRRLCRRGLLAYRKLSHTNWLVSTKSIRDFAAITSSGGQTA